MKKQYVMPNTLVDIVEFETMLAESSIDYAGSNAGDDKPHEGEVDEYKWNIWDIDVED